MFRACVPCAAPCRSPAWFMRSHRTRVTAICTALCARPNGTGCACNARIAVLRARASPITHSKARRAEGSRRRAVLRYGPRPASSAAGIARYSIRRRNRRLSRWPMTLRAWRWICSWANRAIIAPVTTRCCGWGVRAEICWRPRGALSVKCEALQPLQTPRTDPRDRAARTRRAAIAAKSAPPCLSSMVALVAVAYFSAEHPVRQPRVGKNDRQDDQHPDQHENLARARGRSGPDAEGGRHDVRKDADQQAAVAEKDDGFHQDERARLVTRRCRPENADHAGEHEQGHRRKVNEVPSAKPALRHGRLTEHSPEADDADDREQHQR